ncbi:MAG: hypothetical protein ACI350_04980 [Prevotella sp.]
MPVVTSIHLVLEGKTMGPVVASGGEDGENALGKENEIMDEEETSVWDTGLWDDDKMEE